MNLAELAVESRAIEGYLAREDPTGDQFDVFLGGGKGNDFAYAEAEEVDVGCIFEGHCQEKVSDLFFEARDGLDREILLDSPVESNNKGLQKILVCFVFKLMHNLKKPLCWVFNLPHHTD